MKTLAPEATPCEHKQYTCDMYSKLTKFMLNGISNSLKVGSSLVKLFNLASELLQ